MIPLDMRTVIFLNVIINIICTLFIMQLWWQNRHRFAGMAFCVFYFALHMVALTLIVLRGAIPDWMSIVLANTLVFAAVLLMYMGLERFVGKIGAQLHNYALFVLYVGAYVYATFIHPDLPLRILIMTVGLLIINFQCLWLLWRRVEPTMRPMTFGVGMVFGGYCLLCVVRIVEYFVGKHAGNDFFQSGAFQTLVLASYLILLILLTYSLILMVNKRLYIAISAQGEKLVESEERYRELFDNMSSGVAIYEVRDNGNDFIFKDFNKAGERLDGDSKEDIIGKSIYQARPGITEFGLLDVFKRVWKSGIPEHYPATFYKDDRLHKWFENYIYKLPSGDIVAVYDDITDRKQAEEELRFHGEIMTNMTEAVYLIRMDDGVIVYSNEIFEKMFGYEKGEMIGKNVSIVNSPSEKHPEETAKEIMAEIHEKGSWQGDVNNIRKDGTSFWCYARCSLFDHSKYGRVLIAVHTDITDRKRAEGILRESEEKYRILFEGINDAVFVHGLDEEGLPGRFLQVNDVACHRLGYTREELLSLTPRDITIPEEYERITDKRIGLASQGDILVETIHVTKDGLKIPVESNIRQFQYLGRQVALSISRDITERKRMEEALQASEDRFHAMFEQAGDGVFILDTNGKIISVNETFARMHGLTMEEMLRRGLEELDVEGTAAIPDRLSRVMAGETLTFEVEHYHKDGHTIPLSVTANLISSGNDRLIMAVHRDISERKRAEEERRSLQERLQHADKMEAIGTLAGGIAHDFNNLLMGIQGHASLVLLDLDPSHPHYEGLKSIEEQVQSGADLTKQLLGFARGGRYDVKPTDMNDIIKETSSMFGRTKKEISIHRKYGKDLRPVEVDRGQMEQMFMNLYVNAWQAMPGGGEIYLETEDILLDDEQAFPYTITPGEYVKITVTDTGTGMDEKTRERIFDPFFTTKEMGRGTGLGLATVYGIIKGHKGMIHVDSEPGHGTTFHIYLPASEKEVVKEKTVPGTIARGTETILLVDDETMVLAVSQKLLKRMGYRVYAAGCGQEAIAVYMEKQKDIDLVILDMIMPGMSGGETFDRLREINPGIKVLLSSGYSIEGQAQEIMDRGCNGFLQKPFRLANLSRKVREMLD